MMASFGKLVLAARLRVPISPLAATAEALAAGCLTATCSRAQSTSAANPVPSTQQSANTASAKAETLPFYDKTLMLSKRQRQVYAKPEELQAMVGTVAEHGYLYGFSEAELQGVPEVVRKALSTRTADATQLRRFRKEQLLRKLGTNAADSGNSRVQVAMLTDTISRLSTHQGANKHDKGVGRSLQILTSRRRKLLQYMQRRDFDGYRIVLKELGLRAVPIVGSRHPPKVRAETHKQINERNRRLKNRASRGDRGH